MIAFKDCDYSLFISYAHKDDSSEFNWVEALRDAIYMRLDKLDNDIVKKELHFSHENGPTGGTLGWQLQDRVARSFGMLLVVGEKYVDSEWCEKELQFFHDTFGPAGMAGRLYVAAMTKDAITRAEQGEQWQKCMPADQLWVPMFSDAEPNRPLSHRTIDGSPGFPGAFLMQASKIADRLIDEIEKDHRRAIQQASAPAVVAVPRSSGTARRQIVIGPHTASLADKVRTIKLALENAGAEVSVLERNAIDDFDPDSGRPLRPMLVPADVLVVPMTHEVPLQAAIDGGHVTLLSREWAAAGKADRDLVWYRPADIEVPAEQMASERHLKCFNQLSPVCANETSLISHLFGIGAGTAIRLHIENHPQEHAFKRLARQLEDAWDALPPDPTRPMLRCVSLELDDLANASKDVAGVMLLLPVELKDPKSLLDQIDQVQRTIPKKGTYPGCVAILYNPPLGTRVPKHEWSYVQVKRSEVEPRLMIEEESKVELEEFLLDLWERYRRAQPTSAPAMDEPAAGG